MFSMNNRMNEWIILGKYKNEEVMHSTHLVKECFSDPSASVGGKTRAVGSAYGSVRNSPPVTGVNKKKVDSYISRWAVCSTESVAPPFCWPLVVGWSIAYSCILVLILHDLHSRYIHLMSYLRFFSPFTRSSVFSPLVGMLPCFWSQVELTVLLSTSQYLCLCSTQ